jgi:putative tricarboxylic transport membrane protein
VRSFTYEQERGKMDLINGIISVFSLSNLLYCFVGCVMGTLVGVLPGLGPSSTLSILLPITLYLNPIGSFIMLAGVYYGAAYGGSTTSILVNIPGEVTSIVTCFDGYQMARQGRAGEALWIAAVGSFIAGTVGAFAITFLGPGIAKYAVKFGPPEYFGLLIFSLTALISLSGTSMLKGLLTGLAGIILSSVGIDDVTGLMRLDFGVTALMRGIDVIPLAVGLFGIGEILINADAGLAKIYEGKIGKMMPRGRELKKGLLASLRGTILGLPMGVLPGVGILSTWLSYDLEKRISKYPERFGTGVIEGVASPEAANNATAQAGFIPLMAFGIPTTASMAIMLAALILYGIRPGPLLFTTNKDLVWTVIGSMYIGNIMLLVLNLPLVGFWARISTIPYKYLAPVILGVCVIGAYSPRNTMFDVWFALGAGVMGYAMRKLNWPVGTLMLGFILGPMIEVSLRQAISMGGPEILVTRPITLIFLLLAITALVVSLKYMRRVPKAVLEDDSNK